MNLPKDRRDPQVIASAEASLEAPLRVLGAALTERPFLLGTDFTLADLNVASVLATALTARFDLAPFEPVFKWFGQCLSREAAQRCVALAVRK
ncbi:MAG TPA: glutathione S-transferase C-terminal domain-containing protein [Polyangiales bacterium]